MAANPGKVILKYLLFIFNFVFWLSGLAILVSGAVIQIKYKNYVAFLGGGVVSVAVALIILGAVIGIIGFFGCFGAIRENYCLVMTFIFLLVVVFIAEFGAAIASYVLRKDLQDTVVTQAKDGLHLYGKGETDGLTKGWDAMQRKFSCCGVDSYADWNSTETLSAYSVPDSCCKTESDKCGDKAMMDPKNINEGGCINKFVDWIKSNIAIVGGITGGVAIIQVIGLILACCYARSLREGYKSV